MTLDLYSEPYHPQGNIDARAAKRALGKPELDFWTVFLRETLQNSWDARTGEDGPVGFTVDAFTLDGRQASFLRDEVLAELPPNRTALAESLKEPFFLLVSDSGTRGLAGPTRADLAVSADEPTHFVDFVRNIGRDESKTMEGGTYGFGKSVLYEASRCSTILVFSRIRRADGGSEARFIAIELGSSYDRDGRRYTGRHWWGVRNERTGAEPIIGEEAETIARRLGMTTPAPASTGTTIAVLGPDPGDESKTRDMVESIATAATWWAWPHMVGSDGRPSIRFSLSHEGERISPPDPTRHPVLRHYVDAYQRADTLLRNDTGEETRSWPWTVLPIRSKRPAKRLGALAYRRYLPDSSSPGEHETPAVDSHVALMREPRFVVRYHPVAKDPRGQSTAGVFIAAPELDNEFALAEPVAHDSWVPQSRTKNERNPVRQALNKIKAEFKEAANPAPDPSAAPGPTGVARVASELGSLLEGQSGGTDPRVPEPTRPPGNGPSGNGPSGNGGHAGGRQGTGPGGGRSRRRSGTAKIIGPPRLTIRDGNRVAEFPVTATVSGSALRVTADAKVVLEGGAEESANERPVGAELPTVLDWRLETTGTRHDGAELRVTEAGDHAAVVSVRQPADAALTVKLSSVEEE
ncbi:hypothetical protein [Saccharomonospora iraqiensis]|uniref:hypothetical protein n=1 Tax=Saccharomonospora iraqiensis TaxID=52698 RepID=UPI00022DF486|nr:hypothetical protein [Saccharomonospora iraqiensis]